MSEITELLAQLSNENPRATAELTARVYDEIHRLAAAYLGRERADHTLQTTALVHEAYLRLIGQRHRLEESRCGARLQGGDDPGTMGAHQTDI